MPAIDDSTTQIVTEAVREHGKVGGALAAMVLVVAKVFHSGRRRQSEIKTEIAGLRGEVTARINGLERRMDKHDAQDKVFQGEIGDHMARQSELLARLDERSQNTSKDVARLVERAIEGK